MAFSDKSEIIFSGSAMINMEKFHLARLVSFAGKGVQRSDEDRGRHAVVCPLPNFSIEECEQYRQRKTAWQDLCHVQKDYAKKSSPQAKIKKRKKLYESLTTLRNNTMERERCKAYV